MHRRISSFRSYNPSLRDPSNPSLVNPAHQSFGIAPGPTSARNNSHLTETDWSEFSRVEEGEGELGQEREGVSPHDESEEFVDPWTTGSGFASTSAPQDSPSTPATSFHEPSPFLHSLQYTSYEGRPAPSPHSPADYRFPPPADPAPEGYSSVMPPRRPRSPPPPKREEPGEPCVAKDASRKGKGAVEWLELDEADRAELTEKGSAA